MRGAWGLVAIALLASPAWADEAWLAKPEAAITLRVEAIEVGALLTFLAAVGDTRLSIGPGVRGVVRDVAFEGVGAERAFRSVVQGQGLEVRREGNRLRVARPEPTAPPVPGPPIPPRPELVVPPVP